MDSPLPPSPAQTVTAEQEAITHKATGPGTAPSTSGQESAEEDSGTGPRVSEEPPTQLPVTGVNLNWSVGPIALGVLLLLLGAGASALVDLSPRRRIRREW